jgi:mannose-6-phosphate isomerase
VFLPKVWAAEEFPGPLNPVLNPPPGTGEVWLASDRHHVTPVAAGELAGMGLDQLVAQWPEYVLGPGRTDGFPILLKLLNVGQWLSVQVHPGDEAAARLEGEPWGKSEAWHILHAEPGAELVHGLAPGTGQEQVARAVAAGILPDLLARVPAKSGDTFAVPAGTLHSPGPGLLMLEVQQASDVTYRFHDWDRPGPGGQPRPLHVANALEALEPSGPGQPVKPRQVSPAPWRQKLLVRDKAFGLLKYEISGQGPLEPSGGGPGLLFVAQGKGSLGFPGGEHPEQSLAPGQCWLLPAGMAPARLAAGQGMEIFQAWAPVA